MARHLDMVHRTVGILRAFLSIFLASSFSYISNIVHARPHAADAKRYAADRTTVDAGYHDLQTKR